MTKNLNGIYIDFTLKFKVILLFISENFGNKDILELKNQGIIPSRNLEIKNSKIIKGYIFHGFGCDFLFKKGSLDIEFENDSIGFSAWSFYSFVRTINAEITEEDIELFLKKKVLDRELIYNTNIYTLAVQKLVPFGN